MRDCPNCGTGNHSLAKVCKKCGTSLKGVKWKNTRTDYAIYAVIITFIVLLFALAAPICVAELVVTLENSDQENPIEYRIFVDGAERSEGVLQPGGSTSWKIFHKFVWAFTGTDSVTVTVQGVDGEVLGEISLVVSHNRSFNVNMTI